MIKRIRPKPIKTTYTTPQCCVKVDPPARNSLWRDKRYAGRESDPNLCQRPSSYKIGKKHYCRLHAGMKVLDMWEAGQLEEK